MPRRETGDGWVIGLTLALGLLALSTPFAIRFMLPLDEVSAATPARRNMAPPPREQDLHEQRLAYPGGCGVNDFKDHRRIEAQIRRKLQIHQLDGLDLSVSADCVTTVRGLVRSKSQRELAMRAASHPWTTLDAAGLRIAARE